ncbi:MAG TPA: response regulator [Flavobacterium sp.]|jgi:CheY-like chemotaxis protein
MGSAKIKVLLADDDPDDRELFTEAFIGQDAEVVSVSDGIKLMKNLSNAVELPDFIFLDLNMPEKNGLQCLREIRSDSRLQDLIVIIYSTSSSRKDIEDTFKYGANMYVTKPNTFGELRKTVDGIINIDWDHRNPERSRSEYVFKAS